MRHGRQTGFTLIELMVTLLVAAVVLGVGIPEFRQFIANNRMASAANDLVGDIHLARTEAVKRRANVTLCASNDWNGANPACGGGRIADGWIVFADCSAGPPAPCGAPNLNVDAFDVVIKGHGPLADAIVANYASDAAAAEYVNFGPTGFPRQVPGQGAPAFNFQLCDDRGNRDTGGGIAAGRWIQVGPTGRPQIYREQAFVQGAQNPLGGC